MDQKLSVAEAAEAAGVSTQTIRRWITQGRHENQLPAEKTSGAFSIQKSDLTVFLEEQAKEEADLERIRGHVRRRAAGFPPL